jgi:hypothetical protein
VFDQKRCGKPELRGEERTESDVIIYVSLKEGKGVETKNPYPLMTKEGDLVGEGQA